MSLATFAQALAHYALRTRRRAIADRRSYYHDGRRWARIPHGAGMALPRSVRGQDRESWRAFWGAWRATHTVANGRTVQYSSGRLSVGRWDWQVKDLDPESAKSAGNLLGIENGYDCNGYDCDGYDYDGLDSEGYDANGYDCNGYDCDGLDSDGYDANGYDCEGYDDCGSDRSGNCRDGDCSRCDDCRANGSIPAYKSQDRNWHVPPGPTFGVELETEASNSASAERLYAERPDGWIGERDGSLDAKCGVEWIGPPLGITSYADGSTWHKWIRQLKTAGFRSWDRAACGMHVHCGRAAYTLHAQARTVINANEWDTLTTLVAGRSSSRWSAIKKDRYSLHDWQDSDRYVAVNVTRNTLEFRVFKGTLNWASFQKNVQFCAAHLEWASLPHSDLECSSEPLFLAWIRTERSSDYPQLLAFLVTQGRVQAPDATEPPNPYIPEGVPSCA